MKQPKESVIHMLNKYYDVLGNYDTECDTDEKIDNYLEQRIIIRDLIKYLEEK